MIHTPKMFIFHQNVTTILDISSNLWMTNMYERQNITPGTIIAKKLILQLWKQSFQVYIYI